MVLLVSAFQAPVGVPRLECALPNDPAARVYRVIDRGASASPQWWLTMTAPSLGKRVVELPLAEAQVDETRPGAIRLVNRSLNGGLTVVVQPEASAYRLDVFVNFELEVNVWRDLSPDVEVMNTDGPRLDAGCRVLSTPD
jgi:hypothetical protein